MREISRDELKAKLERGDHFKLVMTLGDFAYRAKHIPGSLNYGTVEEALKHLRTDEEVVVYCSGRTCFSSIAAYHYLEAKGYKNLYRYSGGLEEWEQSGYPLEGEEVAKTK